MHVTAPEYYVSGYAVQPPSPALHGDQRGDYYISGRYDYPQHRLGQQGVLPGEPYVTTESTDWGQSITDLAQGFAQYETAQKCLDLNLIRAQQGQPPIDCASYGTGVQVGLSPATQQMLLIAAGILAGAYILPKLLRR